MATLSTGKKLFTEKTDEQLNQLSTRFMDREQTLRQRLSKLAEELLSVGRLMRSSAEGSTEKARHRERALATLRRKKAVEKQLDVTCLMAERIGDVITRREEAREAAEAQEALQQSVMMKSINDEDIEDVIDQMGVYDVERTLGGRAWNAEMLGIDDAELEEELETEVYKNLPPAPQASTLSDGPAEENIEAEAQPLDKEEERCEQEDVNFGPEDEEWLQKLAMDNDNEVVHAAQMLRKHSFRSPVP